MELNWITPQQAAKKWNVTDRRIQDLCLRGRIEGAVRLGRGWLIPKNTQKPDDGRKRNGRAPAKDNPPPNDSQDDAGGGFGLL
jgi:excisionase family DNA binding protein